MEQHDLVRGIFCPRNPDDLAPGASEYIGVRLKWAAGWLIEPEDGGPYIGEFAMVCRVPRVYPFGWVPSGDLIEVEEIE